VPTKTAPVDAAPYVVGCDLASTPRVVVRFQAGPCACCEGRDYQHREEMARTLRGIDVLPAPRPLPLSDRASREFVVLATATARAPWGKDVEVWAVAYRGDGRDMFAAWEYAEIRR